VGTAAGALLKEELAPSGELEPSRSGYMLHTESAAGTIMLPKNHRQLSCCFVLQLINYQDKMKNGEEELVGTCPSRGGRRARVRRGAGKAAACSRS
jgi:hypothetical protein